MVKETDCAACHDAGRRILVGQEAKFPVDDNAVSQDLETLIEIPIRKG
jgi:hypothetical protein